MNLIEFLLARIDEDESLAREAAVMPYGPEIGWIGHVMCSERDSTRSQDEHILRWDPARVLGECEVKRQIVSVAQVLAARRHADEPGAPQWHEATAYQTVLTQLALPYADHPDYRDEWAP